MDPRHAEKLKLAQSIFGEGEDDDLSPPHVDRDSGFGGSQQDAQA